MFVGVNLPDLLFPTTPANAVSSARMFLSHPSTFLTASDPRIFGHDEVIIHDQSTDTTYTPADYPDLFDDAGLRWVNKIADRYIGFVDFADPDHFPNVDVYAEKGSGLETLVGLGLADLSVGQLVTSTTELHARWRHQPGGHHQRRSRCMGRDGLLPFQPDGQPGREPLRAGERPGRVGQADRGCRKTAIGLLDGGYITRPGCHHPGVPWG